MSYKIEGSDIVISGWEKGIAESPYQGIADMRNIEIIGVPTQASVNFKETAATVPPVMNAVAYTAQDAGNTITIASTTGLYVGCAIVLAANTATGISNGVVYYVFNIVGNTFQIRLAPAGLTAINITSNGTGTLTTYQYGNTIGIVPRSPVAYYVDREGDALTPYILIVDGSLYVWAIFAGAQGTAPANSLIFLGNIGGIAASSTSRGGIMVWNSYILLFGITSIDIAKASDLVSSAGPAAAWSYSWQSITTSVSAGRISVITSQEDGNLYYTSSTGVGSIIETPGSDFDPSTGATFTLTDDAISLPDNDNSTCLSENKSLILIGGQRNFVYSWDKLSLGFNSIITLPEFYTQNIVTANDNSYIFTGTKGSIYITNGSSISPYKKIPEYVTGDLNPYITWNDASCARNQIYFSFTSTSNSGSVLSTTTAAWAIDLSSDALRVVTKATNSGYGGTIRMVTEMPTSSISSPPTPVGTGLAIGWYTSSPVYGVDVPSGNPFDSYESYIETDMIPVGTFLKLFTPSQIEWKTSYPLGGGGTAESIRISYRKNLLDSFTVIGTTMATGTSVVGTTTLTTTGSYVVSDYYTSNFQNAQWVQLKIEMSSNTTTPTYNRLTEVRIRNLPTK